VTLGILVGGHVTGFDGVDELGKFVLVLLADLGESENRSSLEMLAIAWSKMHGFPHLLVDDSAESGLALNYHIRNSHLSAKSWQENDKLDRVNVVGNEDERSLLVLNQGDDVVEAVLDGVWLLAGILLLLALADRGGLLVQTLLLLSLGLWAVLVEELESLRCAVAVEDVVELSDRRRNLEAHRKNLALTLETNVLGPFY